MSAKTFMVDSGGVTRRLKTPWAIDSGGIPRKAKKIWVIDAGSVARLVFLGADILSLFSQQVNNAIGFAQGAFGSLTPNTLADGAVVNQLTISNNVASTPHQFIFILNNYPGSITQNYLASISVGPSETFAPGDANFSGFNGGTLGGSAQWTWLNAFAPGVGSTTQITVVRS